MVRVDAATSRSYRAPGALRPVQESVAEVLEVIWELGDVQIPSDSRDALVRLSLRFQGVCKTLLDASNMCCSSSSRAASGGHGSVEDSLNGVLVLVQKLGLVEIPVDVQVALPELALEFQAVTKELMVLQEGVAPARARHPGNVRHEKHRQPFVDLCQGDPNRAHWLDCSVKRGMDPHDADRDWWWVAGQPDYHGWCLICRKRGMTHLQEP